MMNYKELQSSIQASYNAVLPASVRYDPNFTDKQKLFYAELSAHMNHLGYCEKENPYFAKILDVSPRTISRFISDFIDRKYLEIEIVNGNDRRLYLPMVNVSFIAPPKMKDSLRGVSKSTVEFMDSLIDLFCKKLETKVFKNKAFYPLLLERMETFSNDEMIQGFENRISYVKSSEWHNEEENKRHRNNLKLLIKSDEDFHKYLTMSGEEDKENKSLSSFEIDKIDNELLE